MCDQVLAGTDNPWPARLMCLEEIILYRTAGVLTYDFPRHKSEVAVVLLFPPKMGQDFAIQVKKGCCCPSTSRELSKRH